MAHVFQVGAGSGGMVVLDLLGRDERITQITLVEPDVYKPHNVVRHYFPPADVAADLAMQPGAVRVAKSRVLLRLRRELGDVGE